MSAPVSFSINGAPASAPPGVTLGSVLHARGAVLRLSPAKAAPRGLYCGMGVCFECVVTVDGQRVRACVTTVRDGMAVEVGR
ncbi:(2Fe-2S)-binding protein [Ensifer soli]|uniref:(2Fe-2S)-binding protein n=1 Tax=Ciceribacter sp. sgz301302 TaxID=3342379 RepID=UPI0035B9833A